MDTIKRNGVLVLGIALLLGALLVGAGAIPTAAQSNQGNQGDCLGGQGAAGMMGGNGMMGGVNNGNGIGMGMGGGMMGGMGGMAGMMGDVDRHFIEEMIPHHEDAIAMADLALQKAQRADLKRLAQEIKRVQAAEIEQMRDWYRQWYGTEVPAHDDDNHGMMGRGGVGMGMEVDLDYLRNAGDFDRTFIELMIPHHRMAVMMANMVLVHSQKTELRTLAQEIVTGQSAEIGQMQSWYRQWYGTGAPR